jgi:hypothetical protein
MIEAGTKYHPAMKDTSKSQLVRTDHKIIHSVPQSNVITLLTVTVFGCDPPSSHLFVTYSGHVYDCVKAIVQHSACPEHA